MQVSRVIGRPFRSDIQKIRDASGRGSGVIQSKSSTVPGKPASAGDGDAVRAAQNAKITRLEKLSSSIGKHGVFGQDPTVGNTGKVRSPAQMRDISDKLSYHAVRLRQNLSSGSGKGRGNWGHAGRPGERGGSA